MKIHLTTAACAILVFACAKSTYVFPRVGMENEVDQLWSPLQGAGYLAFVAYPDDTDPRPIVPIPGTIPMSPGNLGTEEDTGWSDPDGVSYSDLEFHVDNHAVAGNRADFDWVREDRDWEAAHTAPRWHLNDDGLLTFKIVDNPQAPPHVSGSEAHDHGGLAELALSEFGGSHFNRVDVMSIALLRARGTLVPEADQGLPGETDERAAALDYDLWFVDLQAKTSTHGLHEIVFAEGWHPQTWFDDYVTRWRPAEPGMWNAVAIEPHHGDGRDGTCEIDAVVAALVP